MKLPVRIVVAVLAASVALIGCGKSATSNVESSFASAQPAEKEHAQKAVDATKAGNYAEAMTHLQTLAANTKLTPDQQQAVKELLAQVQKDLQEKAAKATEGASKAMGDLQKSLKK